MEQRERGNTGWGSKKGGKRKEEGIKWEEGEGRGKERKKGTKNCPHSTVGENHRH